MAIQQKPIKISITTLDDALQVLAHATVAVACATGSKVLKLPAARFHELRHSHAVNLLSAGVDFECVSKWLGHKTLSMTLDIYGDYISPEVLKPAGCR